MKKWIILFSTWFAALNMIGQVKSIPAAVKKAFEARFPAASHVHWGKESRKEYEAEFLLNGKPVSANFDLNGKWIETETTINKEELPQPVLASIFRQYPDAKYKTVERVEMPGKTQYEMTLIVKGRKKNIELRADGSKAE
ncbi:MAG TPA: PepSY-like domain-containing protein [Chitinophagaceae bacterium]|nr:PepSY-like domain-containing protein [Chitinophagaceae bacterium]